MKAPIAQDPIGSLKQNREEIFSAN